MAKALARALNYLYIDSGAMYRAVTFYFLEEGVRVDHPEAVTAALTRIEIGFERRDGQTFTLLNGRNVEAEIRRMRVSEQVSQVAAGDGRSATGIGAAKGYRHEWT